MLERLTGVALVHRGHCQGMKPRLGVGPEVHDARLDHSQQRQRHLLERFTDEVVLLWRLTNHGRGVDRVLAGQDSLHSEHREVSGVRVVSQVVSEGALSLEIAFRDTALQNKLGMGGYAVTRGGPLDHLERPAQHQGREQTLIDSFREWGNGRKRQRWRAAQEHTHWQRLAEAAGLIEVEAAALLDLPVHAGAGPVVSL